MKTTMATVKAFIKRNPNNLFVKIETSFDGMTDCIEMVQDSFRKVTPKNALGFDGVFVVGSSRDYIKVFENTDFIGFEISNCCGMGFLVTNKY